MEYIVILDPDSRDAVLLYDSRGFVEKFASYQSAKEGAELYKDAGDCRKYEIFALCTDSKNYVV